MFNINKKLITASVVLALGSTLSFAAPSTAGVYDGTKNALDGGMTYPRKNGTDVLSRVNSDGTDIEIEEN